MRNRNLHHSTVNCFLIFVYHVLGATLPSLCHVNQYVLLLQLQLTLTH